MCRVRLTECVRSSGSAGARPRPSREMPAPEGGSGAGILSAMGGQGLPALDLDPGSLLPVSVQLTEQLKGLIRRGSLATGTRLPSVRELAGFLRINRNTVVRAMADL